MARMLDTAAATDAARRLAARALSQPDTLGAGDCEQLRGGLLGQPVNTASSAGYVAVGVWLLARSRRIPRRQRMTAGLYGAFVALSGAGSVAYHGPQFTGAQLFHDLPIVGMLGLGLGVPVVRRIRGEQVFAPESAGRIGAVAALGAAGGIAYLAGRTGSPTCDAGSVLQFHGIWHLCTGAAAGLWATVLWTVEPLHDEVVPSGDEADGAELLDRSAGVDQGGSQQ